MSQKARLRRLALFVWAAVGTGAIYATFGGTWSTRRVANVAVYEALFWPLLVATLGCFFLRRKPPNAKSLLGLGILIGYSAGLVAYHGAFFYEYGSDGLERLLNGVKHFGLPYSAAAFFLQPFLVGGWLYGTFFSTLLIAISGFITSWGPKPTRE